MKKKGMKTGKIENRDYEKKVKLMRCPKRNRRVPTRVKIKISKDILILA